MPASARPARRTTVRYVVVGLSHIAQAAVLPAFARAGENSELAGLVSDDAEKLEKLGRKYRMSHRARYRGTRTTTRSWRPVRLPPFERHARPTMAQVIHRPTVREPSLVRTRPPSE